MEHQDYIIESVTGTKKIRMEYLLLMKKRLGLFGIFMTGILKDITLEAS